MCEFIDICQLSSVCKLSVLRFPFLSLVACAILATCAS